MKEIYKHINTDKIIRWGMLSAAILFLLHAVLLGIFYTSLPPVVPLYNQMPWGEPRLAAKIELILPIVITAGFLICNYLLIARLYTTMPLVSRIISVTSLLISLLAFIFILRTFQIIL
jgi:hypothetical protein